MLMWRRAAAGLPWRALRRPAHAAIRLGVIHSSRAAARAYSDAHLGLASTLVKEVEIRLSAGIKLDKSGDVYGKIESEIQSLRRDNDIITAEIAELKKAREQDVADEERLVAQMRQDGKILDLGHILLETSKRIQEFDKRLAGLRCQQVENSKDIVELKRSLLRIEQASEDVELLEEVDKLLMDGSAVDLLTSKARVLETLDIYLERLNGHSEIVQATKKDVDVAIGKLKDLVLDLRVRRSSIDAEMDCLRGNFESGFYEAKRKNARLARLRDQQVMTGKEIALLEQVLHKLKLCERVRRAIAQGHRQKMEEEAEKIWAETETTQKALRSLDQQCAQLSVEGQRLVRLLRAPAHVRALTPETGELREKFIAALREEELASQRLAALRGTQTLQFKLLGELRAAVS